MTEEEERRFIQITRPYLVASNTRSLHVALGQMKGGNDRDFGSDSI